MPLLTLSRENLAEINGSLPLRLPNEALFGLPEKIVQFGTGVLLRGLCDAFVHEANQQGQYGGRIVVIKSTDQGDGGAFDRQNGLFTHVIRGLDAGQPVEEYQLNAAISRTLSARTQWAEIRQLAHSPNLTVVLSNTTEVGIQLDEREDLSDSPPASFPGKLTAFLYERWLAFDGSATGGLVIVATELIPDNGSRLQEICLELAHRGGLPVAFIEWLETANVFCNSLVDRIVPGRPGEADLLVEQEKLGYCDALLCVSEVYRLWAIENPGNDPRVPRALAWPADGLVIAPDIERYRELKLRLLNGTHSLACGLSFLSGCDTVRQSMAGAQTGAFVENLLLDELAPALPDSIQLAEAEAFGRQVLDRFRNPFIEHKLLGISVNYTAKLRMRVVPLLLAHYRRVGTPPERMSQGFAGYLLFMKATDVESGQYWGQRGGQTYPIQDEAAGRLADWWQRKGEVAEVLAQTDLWGTDLSQLPGLAACIAHYLDPNQPVQEVGPVAAFSKN